MTDSTQLPSESPIHTKTPKSHHPLHASIEKTFCVPDSTLYPRIALPPEKKNHRQLTACAYLLYSPFYIYSISIQSQLQPNPTHHPTPHQPHHYINRQFPRESRATQSKAKQHSVSKCKPIFPNHPRMKKKKKKKKKKKRKNDDIPRPTTIYLHLRFTTFCIQKTVRKQGPGMFATAYFLKLSGAS